MNNGKFIVIYGANNLGKTVQAGILVENLKSRGFKARYLKYPIYDLEPTGPMINSVLRGGMNLSDRELQELFVQNRKDYEPKLIEDLDKGIWVVAEDYKGTGIAWGVVKGISLREMEKMNEGLLDPDLAVLLDGKRFTSGIERGHRHEEKSDWNLARGVHRELAKRYDWNVVDANQHKEKVADDIWKIVEERFLLS